MRETSMKGPGQSGKTDSMGKVWPNRRRRSGQIEKDKVAKTPEEGEKGRFTENYLGRGVGSRESFGESVEESRCEEKITKLGVPSPVLEPGDTHP